LTAQGRAPAATACHSESKEGVQVMTFRRLGRPLALVAVKTVHSAAFLVIQSAILYLVYKGFRRESDRGAAIAGAIATAETLIYAGNGFRCPLTAIAEDLGADSGSVTDIFLPKWLAANVANIYGPALMLGLYLHARNLRGRLRMCSQRKSRLSCQRTEAAGVRSSTIP
jgi:hypothetical protein